MEKALAGKVAIVTGSGSGMGVGIALALAKAGAKVALVGRTVEMLERTRALIEEAGGRAMVAPCDITDRAGRLIVKDRFPDPSGIRRFPNPAIIDADIKYIRLSWNPNCANRPTGAKRPDHPPFHALIKLPVNFLGDGKRSK